MTAHTLALLALLVARVAVNEGALQNPMELALVWQVVEHGGRTPAKRLAFLRRHSPRATGERPCGRAQDNCPWSVQLDRQGGLPPALAARGVRADWWRLRRRDAWLALLWAAERLVTGHLTAAPCRVRPDTWGSVTSERDMAWSRRHGLHRLYCRDALNDGFAWVRR